MQRTLLVTTGGTLAIGACVVATALASGQYTPNSTGIDVGYPNCSQKMTGGFRVVGVNDGLNYSTNPCITTEAAGAANLSLSANTGWYAQSSHVTATSPRTCLKSDANCLAYNYGYNAGLYAYAAATSAGVSAVTWWLDVETANSWNTNTTQNQNSLQGERDALIARGATTVGVYSTTAQWKSITNGWLNNWPSWGATTFTSASAAHTYCTGHQFTGGPSVLMQYQTAPITLDQDVAC